MNSHYWWCLWAFGVRGKVCAYNISKRIRKANMVLSSFLLVIQVVLWITFLFCLFSDRFIVGHTQGSIFGPREIHLHIFIHTHVFKHIHKMYILSIIYLPIHPCIHPSIRLPVSHGAASVSHKEFNPVNGSVAKMRWLALGLFTCKWKVWSGGIFKSLKMLNLSFLFISKYSFICNIM